jgi:membrane-associated phospholipid phosphatase
MRKGAWRVRWGALWLLVAAILGRPAVASATDPRDVSWSTDWPRFRWWEGANIAALTVGSLVLDRDWQPQSSAAWRGGILFDGAVRDALRGRSLGAQRGAANLSDSLYTGAVLAPYVVDVYFVALGIHENADVALQMTLMNLQSLGLTGVVSLTAERATGRARPYTQDCGPDGVTRDANGQPLFNTCGSGGDNESFYSGHAAATATMAGLTCAHHQHLPLYGGGLRDLAPCVVMIGVSATTGIARVVADRHWATDVITGWTIGALSGYVLPSLLHYGFTSGRPLLAIETKSIRAVPVPQAYAGGAGLGVAGVF